MKNILIIFGIILSFYGCCATQPISTPTKTIIEVRDSIIYLRDSITIEIPKEIEKVVIPIIDTSVLENTTAISKAYLDRETIKLHHTLESKKTMKTKLDTMIVVQYVDRLEEREIIKEVPVEVPYVPTWIIIYVVLTATWSIGKLLWKFK